MNADLDEAWIGALARTFFGVDGQVASLPGGVDRNARLETADGTTYVVKLHRGGVGDIAMQDAVLAHLETRPPAVGVPRRVRASDGRTCIGVAAAGGDWTLRLLTWLDGTVWSRAGQHDSERLRGLGRAVADLDRALEGFEHTDLDRDCDSQMLAAASLRGEAASVKTPLGSFAVAALDGFAEIQPVLLSLPHQAIHNDASDRNVLVGHDGEIAAILDVGKVCRAPRIVGLAVACTCAMLARAGPHRAAAAVVEGYHQVTPILPLEVDLLGVLIRTRVAMSIALAARRRRTDPTSTHLAAVEEPIEHLVRTLGAESEALMQARFRAACGYEPVREARRVRAFLRGPEAEPAAVVRTEPHVVLDWTNGGDLPGQGLAGIGRYLEQRSVYGSEAFQTDDPNERRSVHLGIDVFLPAGEPVHAAFSGTVHGVEHRGAEDDFGGLVLLQHLTTDGVPFLTLYGHLAAEVAGRLTVGAPVRAGAVIGHLGDAAENGGWEPHLHFQVLTDDVGMGTGIYGVAAPSDLAIWSSISPDPNLVLRIPGLRPAASGARTASLRARRGVRLSRALSTAYREPLQIIRGDGAYLYEADGRGFLDLVNSVGHVGHCHPRVVAAMAAQADESNTSTHYLHPAVLEYADRLAATLPDPLSVVLFTNSGSEANDLALRVAQAHTGGIAILTLEEAYHGNLSSLIDISPYTFKRAGGRGSPAHVRVCELPDPYRGTHGADGPAYVADLVSHVGELLARDQRPMAFIAESISGSGGQVDLAPGYLSVAHAVARAAGAVCIADEVRGGLGRVGDAFNSFEHHDVVPDIVTFGGPLGNGHPIGAVVTTPTLAASFANGSEYVNTCGGNPVSARVGLAVLDAIDGERLQANAATVGSVFVEQLRALKERHEAIGDVRGRGLSLGVDLVTDRTARAPATALAAAVREGMKARGVLVSTSGPFDNVLAITPPLVIDRADVALAVAALDDALNEATADR